VMNMLRMQDALQRRSFAQAEKNTVRRSGSMLIGAVRHRWKKSGVNKRLKDDSNAAFSDNIVASHGSIVTESLGGNLLTECDIAVTRLGGRHG
jgi:hypothetical protein